MAKNKDEGREIEFKARQDSSSQIDSILHPLVRKWFYSRFSEYSVPQRMGVMEIHSRKSILVSAPTGSTKTLTAFISILNELVDSSMKNILEDRVYVVYISPLKALNYDIQVNLIEPLREIEALAGKELGIRVAVRTGDTTPAERQGMTRKSPHILITTPESLAIMLNAPKFMHKLEGVAWIVVDEVHALADNKRGVHLSLSLERLERLSSHMSRIGLSATISPLDEIARFLVGTGRSCTIIDVQFIKDLDLKVISPVDDFISSEYSKVHVRMYRLMHELIQAHKTTLVFTNTRAATERVVHNLKDKFPKFYSDSNIGAHHGSLSKEHRHRIESSLRKGDVKCVVCSTSLELGIDIGFIDLVILLGSPKSVARALQRCGRSGHRLHEKAKGRIIVMDRDDLVECAVLLKSALEKKIDTIHIPQNCLDVLAQHILGIALNERLSFPELRNIIRGSYPYRDVKDSDIRELLNYLSGKFVSLEDRHIYARIWYDEQEGTLGRKGRLSRVIYMTNIGTIPDETSVVVKVGNEIVGTIEESFLEKLRPGDVFVLGGSVYEFKYSRGMVAQVNASVNRPPTVPRWYSESLPLSFDLAMEIGRFRRLMSERLNAHLNYPKGKRPSKGELLSFIESHLYTDRKAAEAIYNYYLGQFLYIGIPGDRRIIVESYRDDRRIYHIFHTLFGRRVNDCLSRALAFAVSRVSRRDVELGINDNGFFIASEKPVNAMKAFSYLNSEKLELVMANAIEGSEIFKRRFRHCAARALMILRNYRGRVKNVGRQQVSSSILMNALKRIDPEFSILKEARREVLEDLMDIANAKRVLSMVRQGKIRVEEMQTAVPSPFAFNLIMQGYSDILRMEDRSEFVKRMHELVMASVSLKRGSRELEMPSEIKSADIMKKFSGKKLSFRQEKMLQQLEYVDIPARARAELINAVRSGSLDGPILKRVKEHRKEIEKWPKDISRFLLRKLYEHERENFSYEKAWGEEEKLKELRAEEEKEALYLDFRKAAKKAGLDAQIQYEIAELIDGDVKNKLRPETITWIKGLLSGAVPKSWSDRVVKFLKKKLKEIG